MPWEIFTRKTSRRGTPSITFNRLGRIALNKTATAKFENDAVEFVLLLWDPSKRQVGIRPITKKDQRSYRLAYGKKGNGAGFSAKTFMDHIDFDYEESRSVPVRWDESEAMYIAEIPTEYFKKGRQQPLLSVGKVGSRS
jgi:hypothetical protein